MGASSIGGGQPHVWSLMYVKMPLKLAKLSAATIDKNTIFIAGGIYNGSTGTIDDEN
jgi:hypothetical protein